MSRLAEVFRNRGARLIAGLSALALVGGFTGVALASAPYTVHLKLAPNPVKQGQSLTVTASGFSANTSQLIVFHQTSNTLCATTPAKEAMRPGVTKIIAKDVTGTYSVSHTGIAQVVGQHYFCAYLTSLPSPPPVLLRARAAATYKVVS